MDLAYVDELAKTINGVKSLPVRQDLFDSSCMFDYDDKKEPSHKNWFDKGTELAGVHKKLCKAEGIQIYSAMSETRPHLLNIQHNP